MAEVGEMPVSTESTAPTRSWVPIAMVFACTIIGACAQVLFKLAAARLPDPLNASTAIQLAYNLPLIGGLTLYGINTMLMVLALRKGELSLLYPIISLTYLWVTGICVAFLNEKMNPLKFAGLALIVLGVSVLGARGRK